MADTVDLLLKNLRPWGASGTIDLAASNGKFIAPAPGMTARRTIDAQGRLAVPGFIEPHIHLDKVMINREVRANVSGTLPEATMTYRRRKAKPIRRDARAVPSAPG